VSSYQRQSLETVVINNGRSSKGATGSEVWNLNLDQIESGTGRVLAKQIVPVNGLGSSTFSFEAGTVLYSKLRPYLNKVIVADEAGVATTELVPLRCDPEKLLPEYLAYYLRSPEFLGFANVVVAGAKMPRMVMGEFWKHQVPLPPLPEQRRIAAILDQADALRAKRREALAELDQLTQSIFIEMFGDPVANSANWNKLPLAEVVTGKYGVKAGPFGSALKKEEYVSSGYRVYGQEQVIAGRFDIGDYYISERKYEQLKSCAITEGDLLVSLVGSFGKILIVPSGIEPGIINPRLLKISPNQKILTSKFLAAVLEHPSVQKHFEQVAHGGTMGILNAGLLKQLDVILPPLHLQAAFANRLESAVQIALAHNKFLLELDSLFSSLQHSAFRGEL